LCFVSAARGDEVGADVAARVGAAQSSGLRPRVLRCTERCAALCALRGPCAHNRRGHPRVWTRTHASIHTGTRTRTHAHALTQAKTRARARTRAGALPHLDVTALHEARGRVSVVLEDLQRCIAVKGTENRNKALRVLRTGIGPSEKGMACSRSVSFQLCLQFE